MMLFCCNAKSLLLAQRVISWRRSNSVAFGCAFNRSTHHLH